MNALVADMVSTDPVEQRLLEGENDARKIFFRNLLIDVRIRAD